MFKVLIAVMFTVLMGSSSIAVAKDERSIININTATVEMLDTEMAYVGESIAKKIVDYREKHGDFKKVEDLTKVKGIGSRILNANKEYVDVK